MGSFKYVFIPADTSQPPEERELKYKQDKEVESLLDELKAHFARVRPQKTAAQRAAQIAQLRAQLGPGAEGVDEGLLAAATGMQMVESVGLLPNLPAHRHVGVNMYVDDEGSIVGAPLNPRASELATLAGRPVQVRGDAFLARVLDDGDAFQRLDFGLADLSSSAPWVAAARAHAEATAQRERPETTLRRLQQQEQRPAVAAATLSPGEALKQQGNEAFKRRAWVEAVELYSQALESEPGLLAARNNRAQALLQLERWPEAAADATVVLEVEPSNVKALLRRAAAARGLGDGDGAAQDLRAVLELQPKHPEAAAMLATL